MVEILTNALAAIFIAAVTSWITVQLSLRRLRSERWWERKANAYERVIEALHHSKEFTELHLEAEHEGEELPEGERQALRDKSEAAHAEVRRATNLGAFLLSDQAIERVRRYRREERASGKATSWLEYLAQDWATVDSCLDDLIKLAKEDLRVHSPLERLARRLRRGRAG